MSSQRRAPLLCISISCVLIVFIGLIPSSNRPYLTFDYRFTNQNTSIEEALQQIPTCTSNDRSRQRALLHTLQAWKHFAQQNRIQYWIAYDTLLGYVQNHALLPNDSNIDLFIMAYDTSELFRLSHFNFSLNYKLKVHPQWYFVDQIERSYFYSEEIDFLLPNARFINIDKKFYLNIWPVYDYNPNETRMAKTSKAMLTAYNRNYQWKSTPREWTFPLRECEFSGIKVWCPAEAEKLVSDIYGAILGNLSSLACFNDSWVEPNQHQSAKTTSESTTTEESSTS